MKCCPADDYCEIVLEVGGGMVGLVLVVGSIFYRNWRYEQELDSLLWKIEYKELQVEEMITMTDRICLARPITSQCVCVCVCLCVCVCVCVSV